MISIAVFLLALNLTRGGVKGKREKREKKGNKNRGNAKAKKQKMEIEKDERVSRPFCVVDYRLVTPFTTGEIPRRGA